MIFDVMVREGWKVNEKGEQKQIVRVYRVHDRLLAKYIRGIQDVGRYVISVIPLFRSPRVRQGGVGRVHTLKNSDTFGYGDNDFDGF